MDNFQYSVQLSDQDWAEFSATADECGLLQAGLASGDELLSSDIDQGDSSGSSPPGPPLLLTGQLAPRGRGCQGCEEEDEEATRQLVSRSQREPILALGPGQQAAGTSAQPEALLPLGSGAAPPSQCSFLPGSAASREEMQRLLQGPAPSPPGEPPRSPESSGRSPTSQNPPGSPAAPARSPGRKKRRTVGAKGGGRSGAPSPAVAQLGSPLPTESRPVEATGPAGSRDRGLVAGAAKLTAETQQDQQEADSTGAPELGLSLPEHATSRGLGLDLSTPVPVIKQGTDRIRTTPRAELHMVSISVQETHPDVSMAKSDVTASTPASKPQTGMGLSTPACQTQPNMGLCTSDSEPQADVALSTPDSKLQSDVASSIPASEPPPYVGLSMPASEPQPNVALSTPASKPQSDVVLSTPACKPQPNMASSISASEPLPNMALSTPASKLQPDEAVSTSASKPQPDMALSGPASEPQPDMALSAPASEPQYAQTGSTPASTPSLPVDLRAAEVDPSAPLSMALPCTALPHSASKAESEAGVSTPDPRACAAEPSWAPVPQAGSDMLGTEVIVPPRGPQEKPRGQPSAGAPGPPEGEPPPGAMQAPKRKKVRFSMAMPSLEELGSAGAGGPPSPVTARPSALRVATGGRGGSAAWDAVAVGPRPPQPRILKHLPPPAPSASVGPGLGSSFAVTLPEAYEFFFCDTIEEEDEGAAEEEAIQALGEVQWPDTCEFFFRDCPAQRPRRQGSSPATVPPLGAEAAPVAPAVDLVPISIPEAYEHFLGEEGLGGVQPSAALLQLRTSEQEVGPGASPEPSPATAEQLSLAVRQAGELCRPLAVPFSQNDMCLVFVAFATWAVRTSDLHTPDAWKTVLLANIGTISAIRYFRRRVRRGRSPSRSCSRSPSPTS
ncbi:PGC-1 and ERR-induced regulator in muscle protein 1 [Sciurus carolinensis]|uniref:PGC-1 and ERR-induced regulator in muscle protein 1 n=2 Tax=Sciuridae TaxID=55153 RepID=A0AA41N497_SCICA|nr:PGC-1 and ERR-induced regulator in muscle protein 1 [Sciurus carolinensis]